jgi:hypothetical protein
MTNAPQRIDVASYLNVQEAELAQMELQAEGVPAWLENASLVSWAWYYINATGGVKVCVLPADVERARAILHPPHPAEQTATPSWRCKHCGADVEAAWTTCWHCGTSKTGEEDPAFFQQPAVDQSFWHASQGAVAVAVGISGPVLFAISHGSILAIVAWAVVVACMLTLQSWWQAEENGVRPEGDVSSVAAIEPDAATERVVSDEYVRFEATVRRAWWSAVLTPCFLPLSLYAVWLLVRVDWPAERWKPRERRRYIGAWAVSLAWIMLVAAPFWLMWR